MTEAQLLRVAALGKQARPSFLKKRSKRLLSLLSRRFLQRAPKGTKVFWFFFQKRTACLLLQAARPTRYSPGPAACLGSYSGRPFGEAQRNACRLISNNVFLEKLANSRRRGPLQAMIISQVPAQDTRTAVERSRELRECSQRRRAETRQLVEQSKVAVTASQRYRHDIDSQRPNCWFVRHRPYDVTVCRSVCFCRVIKAIMPAC